MKSRIILFLIVVFTLSSLSVVYANEVTASKPNEAKIYLEYALLTEDKHSKKVDFFAYLADFFNLGIEGEIGFGADENSEIDLAKYALIQTKPSSLTIRARKTILAW